VPRKGMHKRGGRLPHPLRGRREVRRGTGGVAGGENSGGFIDKRPRRVPHFIPRVHPLGDYYRVIICLLQMYLFDDK